MAISPRGRSALTHYTVIERLPGATLVQCRLETGRTHQIRVHMRHIGHPILGDPVYGVADIPEIRRQALHAAKLEFTHPRSGERLVFRAPLPGDFAALLDRLRQTSAPSEDVGRVARGGRRSPEVARADLDS